MTNKEKDECSALIAEIRQRTVARVRALEHDRRSIVEASEDANLDDEHDPEGATIAFERAQVAALLAASRARLHEIDRAVQRCKLGSYGICESCGEAIPEKRLAARPSARTCLRCAL